MLNSKRDHIYAIGLGSNRSLTGLIGPRRIVEVAMTALDFPPFRCVGRSLIITSRPIGPSQRSYANAVVLVVSALPPLAMLDHLQALERLFGRHRYRRWGARTLDLDILLWSGGRVSERHLTVPHPLLSSRHFVLAPLASIAAAWRHPVSNFTIRQLAARLSRYKPVDRAGCSL